MESANLHHHHHHHHHQLQEHQLLVGSSSLATPISLYGVGIINNNSSWNQNLILNNAAGQDFNLSSSGNGILSNSSRDLRQNNNNEIHHHQISPSLSTTTNSMIHDHQDLGFHWATTTTGRSSFIDDQYSAHDQVLHLAKIKKELISSSEYSHHDQEAGTYLDEFQLAVAAAASARNNYLKLHDQELEDLHDLSSSSTTTEKQLFLRNLISSGDHLYYCNPQNPVGSFAHPYSSTRSGIFSQIFPSTNISNPNPSSLSSSFSSTAQTQYPLGMNNFQALDLLSSSPSSTKIGGNGNTFGQDSSSILSQNNNLGRGREVIMKESHRLSYDDHHHHLDHHDLQIRSSSSLNWPLNNPSKMSSCLMNVGGRDQVTTKRSSCCSSSSTTSGLATKASHHTAAAPPKKPRLESRSSFPPIKVRKEKLGDRIANLQQLVAPFGKTDTASVLMEAIGYIKFLQEQVETLSVPYMKSSSSIRNINIRPKIQRGSMAPGEGEMDEPIKRDLRSRGLCLVPLSCTSYITNDVDLGVNWSSPHYGGGRL